MTDWVRSCSGGDCPEYRYVGGRVEIRDSARPAEVAWFRQEAWEKFLEALSASVSAVAVAPSLAPAKPPVSPSGEHPDGKTGQS